MKKLVNKVQRYFSARNKYWTTLSELNRLSDRDLKDIGIHRCDIQFVARKHSKCAS